MEEKIAEYQALGVDLVWVLDPHTLTLRCCGKGQAPVLLRDADTVSADPYVAGFSCRVSEFFKD